MSNIYGISKYGRRTITPAFELPAHGYIYRPLKRGDSGWDVYALQSGLQWLGHTIITELNGYFDADLHHAVRVFQKRHLTAVGGTVDGIAGVLTQRAIAATIAPLMTVKYNIPKNQLKGQMEKESAFWLGNHSPQYSDESHDVGVTQRNTRYVSLAGGFNVPVSIEHLAAWIRSTYNAYSKADPNRAARLKERGLATPTNKDRWRLAAGSWNRPAHTAWLAGEPNVNSAKPSPDQLTWILGYMDRVCVYSDLYYQNRAYPT